MTRVTSMVQNGTGRLVLNDSTLFDCSQLFYVDIPTTSSIPYRVQFKIQLLDGENTPEIKFTKFSNSILEISGTFYNNQGSFAGSRKMLPIKISGGNYNLIFCLTRLIDLTFRAEISLYEV